MLQICYKRGTSPQLTNSLNSENISEAILDLQTFRMFVCVCIYRHTQVYTYYLYTFNVEQNYMNKIHIYDLHPPSQEILKPNSLNLLTSTLHLQVGKNLLKIIFSDKEMFYA
jgi:hypothetical protein